MISDHAENGHCGMRKMVTHPRGIRAVPMRKMVIAYSFTLLASRYWLYLTGLSNLTTATVPAEYSGTVAVCGIPFRADGRHQEHHATRGAAW